MSKLEEILSQLETLKEEIIKLEKNTIGKAMVLIKDTQPMSAADKIRQACCSCGVSQNELAKRLNISPSSLSQKLKRNFFTTEELEDIAKVLGGVYISEIVFPDEQTEE